MVKDLPHLFMTVQNAADKRKKVSDLMGAFVINLFDGKTVRKPLFRLVKRGVFRAEGQPSGEAAEYQLLDEYKYLLDLDYGFVETD